MRRRLLIPLFALLVFSISPRSLPAAGSPYTTLVVANSRSGASLHVAAHYARKRHIPAANIVYVDVQPDPAVAPDVFQRAVVEPVWQRMAKLDDRITHVAVMLGIPYRVGGHSATTVLAFGGVAKMPTLNPFYNLPMGFSSRVDYLQHPMVLVTMLTAANVEDALALIDRSVAADCQRPTGTLYLSKGAGPRGVRRSQYDQVLERYRAIGVDAVVLDGSKINGQSDVLGWMTGDTWLPVDQNKYMPGAIVDNLTSFGGKLLEPSGQMSILSCISAGASASHGTVTEPTNYILRWPNAMLFLYYMNGFTLAESYWHSTASPILGVFVGDPVMQPWAARPQLSEKLLKPEVRGGKLWFQGEVKAVGKDSLTALYVEWDGKRRTLVEAGPSPGSKLVLQLSEPSQRNKLAEAVRKECPFDQLSITAQAEKGDSIEVIIKKLVAQAADNPALNDPEGAAVEAAGDHIVLRGRRWNGWGSFLQWKCGFVSDKPSPVRVLFGGGTMYARKMQPALAPVRLPAADPVEGDRLILNVRKIDIPVVAQNGDSFTGMVSRMQEMFQKLVGADLYKDLREIRFKYVKSKNGNFIVFFHEPTGSATSFGDLRVQTVPAASGSKWKKKVMRPTFPRPGWESAAAFIPLPVRGRLRVLPVRQSVELGDWPKGFSRFRIVSLSGNAAGTEVTWTGEVEVPGGPEFSVAAGGYADARRQRPVFRVGVSGAPEGSSVLLTVDGRPVMLVPHVADSYTLDAAQMLIGPGRHELGVEVVEGPLVEVPDVVTPRKILARSRPVSFTIAPVRQVRFNPHGIKNGKPIDLVFRGAYLRAGVPVHLAGRTAKLERDKRYPFLWHARFAALPAGRYPVEIGAEGEHWQLEHPFVEVAGEPVKVP